MSRFARKGKAPKGFEVIEQTLAAMETELRDKVNEGHEGKRKVEAIWPIQQINWQRSRYVYDMFYKYKKISREVYEYCIRMKLIDAALIAKWKKPGYERLCSTYVINTKNYKFGTVSICRVPKHALGPDTIVEDPNTGCLGCSSGPGGQRNIFGNKYGQYLASIQVAREQERERRRSLKDAAAGAAAEDASAAAASAGGKGKAAADEEAADEDADTDEGGEEGPMPDTVWAVNEEERNMESISSKASAEAEREAAKAATRHGGGGGGGGGGPAAKRSRYA